MKTKAAKQTLVAICILFLSVLVQAQVPSKGTAFQLDFDSEHSSFSLKTSDNFLNIAGITSVLHTSKGSYLCSQHNFKWEKALKKAFRDSIGSGNLLIVDGVSKSLKIKLQYRIQLYESIAAAAIEVVATNLSTDDLTIYSIEPIHVIDKDSGTMQSSDFNKILLNGAMYYDAGSIHTLGTPYTKPQPYGETKGGIMHSAELSGNPETVQSWWNIALFKDYNEPALSIAYIESCESLGRIQLLKTAKNKFNFSVESVYSEGHVLPAGKSLSSDRVLINVGGNPYETLETYGSALGKANGALTGKIVNGWCNWFYTHDIFDEKEILENAEFVSRNLKGYGLEYIQIDEGFQRMHGEWEGNSRFPVGLKSFAEKIKEMGLKPGIWIAPFVISENSWVHKNHPDWLLRNADGSLKRIGPWPCENTDWFNNENPKRYSLDITHPQAEQWFAGLIDSIANNWGFEMIKIDFVAWTVFSADHFYDPAASPAKVYKKALKIMHSVAGDDCHILDCGPGHVSVGSIHSMRIEYDQNYGFFPEVWKQYFLGSSSSAGALGKRYFYHNRAWTNDIDHICLDLVSETQAESIASLIALSGGNLMSGDRLTVLYDSKIGILQKVFPASGISARPVNILDTDPQTAFAVQLTKNAANWTVAGFFNPDLQNSVKHIYPVERLWLDSTKEYLCFDFWNQTFLGEMSDTLSLTVNEGGVKVLAIREKQQIPQLLSTTRHILQGFVEIDALRFDVSTSKLSGTSTAPLASKHSVYIYVPEPFIWNSAPGKLYWDFGNYSVKYSDNQVIRIDLDFSETESIDWEISFEN